MKEGPVDQQRCRMMRNDRFLAPRYLRNEGPIDTSISAKSSCHRRSDLRRVRTRAATALRRASKEPQDSRAGRIAYQALRRHGNESCRSGYGASASCDR
jgi:hypothetical protein